MGTGVVQVPPDSTGKKIDCASVSVSGATVYRQVVVIGDPTASAGYATVTGGAVKVTGTIDKISATVAVSGQVSLGPGTSNIGTINNISAAVVLAAGAANIGTINNISAAVVLGAGTANIGAVSNAAGTALMGAVSLAAGTANIGFINNISAPVVLGAGTALIGAVSNAAGTALMGAVSLAAGTANIGFINNISAPVVLAAGTNNIGSINNISATVNVAGTFTIGSLAAGTNNIGTVGISSGTLAMSGMLDGISASVNVAFASQLVYGASITVGTVLTMMGVQAKLSAGAQTSAAPAWADLQGRQVIMPFHPPLAPSASHGPKAMQLSTSATTALIAAPGATFSIYVTSFRIQNTAPATNTVYNVFEGANSAAPVIKGYLGQNTTSFCIQDFRFEPPLRVSANTALNITCDTNTSDVYINIHFYVGP